LSVDETLKTAVVADVINAARTLRPDVQLGHKYGGTVFMGDADVPASLMGGVFASANHVSVEFFEGATFDDPQSHLEGKGKARRHVKLRSLGDIGAKDVAGFLAQAFS